MSTDKTFKQLIDDHGHNPHSLSERAGVAYNTVRELYRGDVRGSRSFDVKNRIANALDLDLSEVQSAIRKTREENDSNE